MNNSGSTVGDSKVKEEKPSKATTNRKIDHLEICCDDNYDVEMSKSTGFEDILFVHKAAPEINFDEITLDTQFLKHKFNFPIFISPITGGAKEAKKINKMLGKIAEKYSIGIGVGSQRAALEDSSLESTFKVVRENAPTAFVAANLGAIQLNNDYGFEEVNNVIEMISANALVLHLNPLQEIIQPEGDTNFRNLIPKIAKMGKELKQPVIVKEIGSGIALEEANKLVGANVAAIDIAGAGGTSWSKVEAIRANQQGYDVNSRVGELFGNWGIPTAYSTLEVSLLKDKIEIISSGGIRNGLQAAKALAIGANLVGIALPIVRISRTSTEKQLINYIEQFIQELKTAMFLVGAKNLDELKQVPLAFVGKIAQWLTARGFNLQD